MHQLLLELYGHQAWADAQHWLAIERHPPARQDAAIRERLYHIHVAQRAFLSIVQGEPVVIQKPEEFPNLVTLKEYGRRNHEEAARFLNAVTPARLDEMLAIPWFTDPPIQVTVGQALTQAAMHSHYHRGQNATRLRELGGDPPLTDLVIWYWKGRPAAEW